MARISKFEPIPDVVDNIYEKMIKEYVAFAQLDDPNPWNPVA